MNTDVSEFATAIDDDAYGRRKIGRAPERHTVAAIKTAPDYLSPAVKTSPEHQRLITKLETIAELSVTQRQLLAALPLRIRVTPARTDVFREAQRPTECCLVLDGLACRYKSLADGERQILSLHLPGDVPDLQTIYLETVDYNLCALVPSRFAFISHEALREIMARDAGLATILIRYLTIDGAILCERIANLGRREALQRVAHFFCEFLVCQRALGIASDNTLRLPLTQNELADVAGVSTVHVNRVIRQLRRSGYISSRGSLHRILDLPGLISLAGFSPRYLHLKRPPAALGI